MAWHSGDFATHFRTMAKDGTPTDTVSEIISLYAPPVENPTMGYIAFVLDLMEIPVGTVLNLEKRATMRKLCRAMMHFETGKAKPFGARTAEIVEKALTEGKFPPDGRMNPDPAQKNQRKGIVTGVVAGGGLATMAEASPVALAQLIPFTGLATKAIQIAPWVIGVVIVVALGYGGYLLWKRARHGL